MTSLVLCDPQSDYTQSVAATTGQLSQVLDLRLQFILHPSTSGIRAATCGSPTTWNFFVDFFAPLWYLSTIAAFLSKSDRSPLVLSESGPRATTSFFKFQLGLSTFWNLLNSWYRKDSQHGSNRSVSDLMANSGLLWLGFSAAVESNGGKTMPSSISLLSVKVLTIARATQMTANDINDKGQVVGQFTDPGGVAHGFVYEEDSFCQLDYPGARGTNILGINNLGQMVGMFTTLVATSGFLYDQGTFSPPLTYPGAGNLTVPNGINDRGEIVGVFQYAAPGEHGFHYKAGAWEVLTYPNATEIAAQDINDSGQVVGDFPDAKGTHGFVYLENVGVFTPSLDCPPSTVTALQGINNGGQIVGGYIDAQGHEHPFLYVAGALNPILIPGAISASANGINDRGQVVGNFQSAIGMQSFVAAIRV